MESIASAYNRLLTQSGIMIETEKLRKRIILEAKGQNISIDECLEKHIHDFSLLTQATDLSIICDLMDMGYSWRDVTELYTDFPLISKYIRDASKIKTYTDSILQQVNEERQNRAKQEYTAATEAFENYRNLANAKYSDTDGNNFSEHRDGDVVISMMVNDGYSQQTISDVMLGSRYPYTELYLKGLIEKCVGVKRAYVDIQNAGPLENARNEFDVYRIMAKTYMARLGISILNYEDELEIIKELKSIQLPDNLIRKALLKASPVALEPGRSISSYVDALMSGNSQNSEFNSGLGRVSVMNIEQAYKGIIELYRDGLLQKGISTDLTGANRVYYDCLTARELLQQHYTEKDIINVIKNFSVKSQDATRPNYGLWVVSQARKLIIKEQNILNGDIKNIPLDKTYQELKAQGITATDILISIVRERINLNPSVGQKLYAPFLDKDLAETAIYRYPDFDRNDLKKALGSFPRAILLQGTHLKEEKDYADNILQQAEKRIENTEKINEEQKNLMTEFNRQQGFAYQGLENPQQAQNVFQVGRTALMMLKNGYDEIQVRNAVMESLDSSIGSVESVADHVMGRTQQVLDRLKKINAYEPPEKIETAEDFYLSHITDMHKQRKMFKANMDIEIVRDMLSNPVFSPKDIQEAVILNSPIAIQPGRDESYYGKYVLPNAQTMRANEQKKLNDYHPVPRQQHEQSATDEYLYHKNALTSSISLPYANRMDVIIAETMIMQGFKTEEIAEAMEAESPCRDSQSNYGASIANAAKARMATRKVIENPELIREAKREKAAGNDKVLVTERIIETTTTTTTTITEGGS